MNGERISEITAFLDADLIPRFGLPVEIEPWRSRGAQVPIVKTDIQKCCAFAIGSAAA